MFPYWSNTLNDSSPSQNASSPFYQTCLPRKANNPPTVVSALGIVFSLLFLLPFASSFLHYPADLILFILYIVAFALLVNYIGPMNCGSVWDWHGITGKSACSKFKADSEYSPSRSILF